MWADLAPPSLAPSSLTPLGLCFPRRCFTSSAVARARGHHGLDSLGRSDLEPESPVSCSLNAGCSYSAIRPLVLNTHHGVLTMARHWLRVQNAELMRLAPVRAHPSQSVDRRVLASSGLAVGHDNHRPPGRKGAVPGGSNERRP
jgi:hypothetical protein